MRKDQLRVGMTVGYRSRTYSRAEEVEVVAIDTTGFVDHQRPTLEELQAVWAAAVEKNPYMARTRDYQGLTIIKRRNGYYRWVRNAKLHDWEEAERQRLAAEEAERQRYEARQQQREWAKRMADRTAALPEPLRIMRFHDDGSYGGPSSRYGGGDNAAVEAFMDAIEALLAEQVESSHD